MTANYDKYVSKYTGEHMSKILISLLQHNIRLCIAVDRIYNFGYNYTFNIENYCIEFNLDQHDLTNNHTNSIRSVPNELKTFKKSM